MIKQNLNIFSQNIRKNKVLTDIILENNKNSTDIVFIQELPRSLIRRVPSHINPKGDPTLACLTTLNEPYSPTLIYHKTTTSTLPPMSTRDCQSLDSLCGLTLSITETSVSWPSVRMHSTHKRRPSKLIG